MADVRRVVEAVVRASYGRLVSYLSARSHDVAMAEDALADAFVAALNTWPRDGVPNIPEAWLLQAARRRLIDSVRREQTRDANATVLRRTLLEAEQLTTTMRFPDERLKLLFVCAHPAIDARMHTPLMLQAVLGLDAMAISEAFLVPASTMGQRLARAKAKIRVARIAFEVPNGAELAPRLDAVLEAIYAAYARGWDDVDGADPGRRGLVEEALWLARMVVELIPDEPEALGLLALILYCESRRSARRSPAGAYVPISLQDPETWSAEYWQEADRVLGRAAALGRPGRFQLEAAVQSAHMEPARGGSVDWDAVAVLYEGLVRIAPTIGAWLGRAAAVSEARGPAQGLALLEGMPQDALVQHQPYWALRTNLLRRLERHDEAALALEAALKLTGDAAVRRFLSTGSSRSLPSSGTATGGDNSAGCGK